MRASSAAHSDVACRLGELGAAAGVLAIGPALLDRLVEVAQRPRRVAKGRRSAGRAMVVVALGDVAAREHLLVA